MMKKILGTFAVGLMLAAGVGATETNGVTPGDFTMDMDAAKAYAAENKLPILIDFSGSDWCGWCQIMDQNIFEQPEWKIYAASNVVMVLIDFPQDETRVPEKFKARNEALAAEYGVEGFPTFVVLDDDGKTELGRLSAGEDKTPESFKAELERLFKNRAAATAEFMAGLSSEDKEKYESLKKALEQKQSEMQKIAEEAEALMERSGIVEEEIVEAGNALREFRIALRGEDVLKEYRELKAQLEAKEKVLTDWIQSEPEETPENLTKFEDMREELMELYGKLEAF